MSRTRFAYPLVRGVDGDSGGAAELQTDVMRFMAILSLCLVAIFALVQSIPVAPVAAPVIPAPEPVAAPEKPRTMPQPETAAETAPPERLVLTRPPAASAKEPIAAMRRPVVAAPPSAERVETPKDDVPREDGFTLRFESDLALTRLVASGQVGFFAVGDGRAQRMTVGDSRISFWDASTPAAYHEMQAATVPSPVIDALLRTGVDPGSVNWGVTLPGRLRSQLATLMQKHSGGALVIGANGNLAMEPS